MTPTKKALAFGALILALASVSVPSATASATETARTSAPSEHVLTGLSIQSPATDVALGPAPEPSSQPAPSLNRGSYSAAVQPKLSYPVAPAPVSSGFGYRVCASGPCTTFHEGVDYASGEGAAVHPIAQGVVLFAGYDGNYGNKLVIEHNINGEYFTSIYGHLLYLNVAAGQYVMRGDQVAAVGNTGRSYGAHLHFEIRPGGGAAVDPLSFLAQHAAEPFPG
jgi:murein DD-endopeptidase MepM/ murein hydrolase activator NlpD